MTSVTLTFEPTTVVTYSFCGATVGNIFKGLAEISSLVASSQHSDIILLVLFFF